MGTREIKSVSLRSELEPIVRVAEGPAKIKYIAIKPLDQLTEDELDEVFRILRKAYDGPAFKLHRERIAADNARKSIINPESK